jgi:hypothetical protein
MISFRKSIEKRCIYYMNLFSEVMNVSSIVSKDLV